MAVILTAIGPPAFAAPADVGGGTQTRPRFIYQPAAPVTRYATPPEGWGVAAQFRGLSVDLLAAHASWTSENGADPQESSAGLHWRGENAFMVFGYRRLVTPELAPTRGIEGFDLQRPENSDVVGFSLTLHSR